MLTYGSLFTGAGGLEMGVQSVLPGRTLWHSDIDPGACKVIEHRWPDVPNLGDIACIDWSAVPRVDVLTGGFPCQDVSTAGARAGLKKGTRSGLFHEMMRAIDALRPGLVVIENVRGLLTAQGEPDPPDIEVLAASAARLDRAVTTIHRRRVRAVRRNQEQHVQYHTRDLFRLMGRLNRSLVALRRARRRLVRAIGTVVGRLADIGYDAQWYGLRAADVGAPHGRFRVFVFAWPAADSEGEQQREPLQRVGQRPQPWRGNSRAPADPARHRRHQGRTQPARLIRRPHAPQRSPDRPLGRLRARHRTMGARHRPSRTQPHQTRTHRKATAQP